MADARKRVALITGAAGGIGSETARLFLSSDWDVITVDQKPSTISGATDIPTDLAHVQGIRSLCQKVLERFDRLDAIVNVAAEQITKSLVETTADEWDRVMAINVRSIYLLAAELNGPLCAAKGAVVNVSSVHAVATSSGMAAYVASKGAVTALTRAMSLELAPHGVRVNAVLPGAIDTPMLRDGLKRSKSSLQSFAARHPLGRIGAPKEVAEAILFLADNPRSSFITGQTLIVDGGATARLSTE